MLWFWLTVFLFYLFSVDETEDDDEEEFGDEEQEEPSPVRVTLVHKKPNSLVNGNRVGVVQGSAQIIQRVQQLQQSHHKGTVFKTN